MSIFDVTDRSQVKEYHLTEADWNRIHEISNDYYGNWDWNYGKSPKFELNRRQRFPIGSVEFKMNVENGLLKEVRIFGDFFGLGEISDVEKLLENVKYERNAINDVLEKVDIKRYFGNIEKEDLLNLIY